jgi:hypothetical protein
MTIDELKAKQMELSIQLDECQIQDFWIIGKQILDIGQTICAIRLKNEEVKL